MMHYIDDNKSQSFSSQTEQLINKIVNAVTYMYSICFVFHI